MGRKSFNVDDIHKIRVQTMEKYRNMSEEEAERDFAYRTQIVRKEIEQARITHKNLGKIFQYVS